MKNYIKSIITIVALLMLTNNVWADKQFTITYQLDGADSSADVAGTVEPVINGTTATLTVTPQSGNYFETDDITVRKTIDGSNAQARGKAPGYDEPVELTVSGTPDITGETIFTFEITDEKFDYEVTVNFKSKTSIEGATITIENTSYTYTGEEIKPEITTVKLADGTELTATDYTVEYANNTNVPASANDPQPTITITGNGIYKGTESTTFTIEKANPVLEFSTATATITIGKKEEFDKPELTTAPEGLEVTYESADTNVAIVDETTGDITPMAAGENIEIKATFAGNDNYNSGSASYLLTVVAAEKGTAEVTTPPTAKTLTYTGDPLELIDAGEATNGEMQYKVGADGTYSTDIPTATNADEYIIYYKAVATDTNLFNDSEEGSVTVTIEKAEGTISYTTASVEKTFGDKAFTNELTNTGDGTVEYTSNNEEVATVDATTGEVTIIDDGEATITATVTDGNNYTYETKTASYQLIVNKAQEEGYGLWIGDVQVTEENQNNVLNDSEDSERFFFNPTKNTLVITNNQEELVIESRLPNLTIFLNDACKLERIYYNNLGDTQNHGTLKITTYNNIPGTVSLATTHADGVISGFDNIVIDNNSHTYLLDPIDGVYESGKLLKETGGEVAYSATIGQYIKPLVNNQTVTFNVDDFITTDEDGNPALADLSNYIVDDILYTLKPETDGEGYDPEDKSICLLSFFTDELAAKVAEDVENGEYIPGGETFAQKFTGITFMVPDGEGTIKLSLLTDANYEFHLKIGTAEPITIVNTDPEKIIDIPYNVTKVTYVYLYMVEATSVAGARPVGKREKAHGRIYTVQVTPRKVVTSNPLGEVVEFPEEAIEEVVTVDEVIPTGVHKLEYNRPADNDNWYKMEGQKINKPTKKGIYIKNAKKIVI